MRTLGIHVKENRFYAPYDDECWVVLAKEIMASYADKYSYQLPTTAFTQEEYSRLDRKTYLPIRQRILRSVERGPLRNVADMKAIYHAFEKRRLEYKKSMGIRWQENDYSENLKY